MGKMTFVVEYEDGMEPPVHFEMKVAGGRLVSAAFFDYRDDFFSENERDCLVEGIQSSDISDRLGNADISSIEKKIELLTF